MPTSISTKHQAFFDAKRDCFPFETLSFDGRLEILDREGRVAVFSRRQKIRFIEDGVSVFVDRAWGDGVILAGYYSRDMKMVDTIRTGKGYTLVLGLPRSFKRGETFEVETERRIIGAYHEARSYWESAMPVPTRQLTMDVIAPRGLTISQPDLIAPGSTGIDAVQRRNRLNLRVQRPILDTPYRLTWSWN